MEDKMRKERFDYLCQQAQSGKDVLIAHGSTNEEGRVLECSIEHMVVDTNEGNRRCWDFHECDEISRSG
jgi:hypothetical protein